MNPPTPSRIQVTGARGMVGRALVRRVRADGVGTVLTPVRTKLDLLDQRAVFAYIPETRSDYVFIAAAQLVKGPRLELHQLEPRAAAHDRGRAAHRAAEAHRRALRDRQDRTKVGTRLGNPSKSRAKPGWEPKTTLVKLGAEMVASDWVSARRDSLVKLAGFRAYDRHE